MTRPARAIGQNNSGQSTVSLIERFFTANHGGGISIGTTFSAFAGVSATLTWRADGKYQLSERSGMRYVFDRVNAGATDSGLKARLLSITDRNGNALTLSSAPVVGCAGTHVCEVTDSLNRALTFSYTNTRITQIRDFTGRTWPYAYDASSDLIAFKNPLAMAGSQPAVTHQKRNRGLSPVVCDASGVRLTLITSDAAHEDEPRRMGVAKRAHRLPRMGPHGLAHPTPAGSFHI